MINNQIKEKEVRVINENKEDCGVLTLNSALALAQDSDLDLVLVSPTAVPPVCRLMDYSKYKYDAAKAEKKKMKNQKVTEVKEIRLTSQIAANDLNTKIKNARKFIDDGNKVRVTLYFRGREIIYQKDGEKTINTFCDKMSDIAVFDAPVLKGRVLSTVLSKKA